MGASKPVPMGRRAQRLQQQILSGVVKDSAAVRMEQLGEMARQARTA